MHTEESPINGRILVVDDNAVKLLKLEKAVVSLGHRPFKASGGQQALNMLSSDSFDVVLLDLQMPEIDGFVVLETLKNHAELCDLPVIVVSSLDDMDSITRAIELGAEDYLDDNFPAEILNARIAASLEKKRRRDTERQFLKRVERVTHAAHLVSEGHYNPQMLGLSAVATDSDSLGRFATGFEGLAEQIFRRERRLNKQISTLRNILLLFITGAVLGLGMPLSRMASEISAQPFAIALWVNVLAGGIGVAVAVLCKRLPGLSWELIKFLFVWGVIGASGFVLIFWVAAHLSGSMLSIIMVTEGFAVFIIAAIFRIEKPTQKRLIGLVLGFIGIFVLIVTQNKVGGIGHWIWLLLALLVPLNYAAEDLFLAAKMPDNLDAVAAIGLTAMVSSLLLLPIVIWLGESIAFGISSGKLELTLLFLALKTVVGLWLLIKLVTTAGAVFGSQVAYVKAFSGILWSMLLLGESMHWVAWVSSAIILVGLVLVDSHSTSDDSGLSLQQGNLIEEGRSAS